MRDNRVSAHECGRTGVKLRQLTKKKEEEEEDSKTNSGKKEHAERRTSERAKTRGFSSYSSCSSKRSKKKRGKKRGRGALDTAEQVLCATLVEVTNKKDSCW